jgi:hypothetical protein
MAGSLRAELSFGSCSTRARFSSFVSGAGAAVPVEAGDMLPHFLFGLGALPAQFFRIKLNNNPCLQENVGELFCARARGHNA